MKRRTFRTNRIRIIVEPGWRDRPHPYWFHARYPGGMRRICLPLLTVDRFTH